MSACKHFNFIRKLPFVPHHVWMFFSKLIQKGTFLLSLIAQTHPQSYIFYISILFRIFDYYYFFKIAVKCFQ